MTADMTAGEWAEGLSYTLKNSGHGPEQITLASASDQPGFRRILETARRIAGDAGWQIIDLSVEDLRRDYRLPERGYLVIQSQNNRLAPEMVQAVATFQHLVTADLPVALLVVASPKAIRSLCREPALGWLSRAEAISEDANKERRGRT
jgi:hypothetical protein